MREGWEILDFEKCLLKVPSTTKIPKKKFLMEGAFPIVSQEEDYINGYWDNEDDVFKVEKPVVLFGDHTKIVKLIDFDFVKGADGIKVFLPKEDINSKFFAYQLQSLELKDLGYARHYRLLKKKKISIPPLPEQKQIVAILDKAFAAIDQAQANIEKNIENAKELFQSNLNDIFSQNGDGWEKRSLESFCSIGDGNYSSKYPKASEFVSSGIPFLTATNLKLGTVVDNKMRYIPNELHSTLLKGHVQEGDLVVVVRGSSTGNSSIIPAEYEGSNLNSQLAYLRPNSEVDSEFLYLAFNNPDVQKVVNQTISGAAQPQLPNNKLLKIEVNVPAIDIQERVVIQLNDLKSATEEIEDYYHQKLANLEDLKKSILQKAFSGELTVLNHDLKDLRIT